MREFIKKYQKAFLLLLVLCCLALIGAGTVLVRRAIIIKQGEEYLSAGDFSAAMACFEKAGDEQKMAECEYAYALSRLDRAAQLMESGRLELAKAELVLMGDFENAPELLLECEYRMAIEMKDAGEYSQALDLAKRLDEHPKAAALIDEIQELIYQDALALTYECRMDEAKALYVKIPGYRDADSLYKRCLDRIAHMETGWSEPVNYSEYAGQNVGSGKMYWHRLGLIYVPYDCDAATTAMIFFPGGYDQALANGYMTDYINGWYGELPNAIMLFCFSNGYGDFDAKIADAHAALEQAAMENNVFLHDVALIGASNGAYTAAHGAVWLYENQGISVKKLVTLDAGQHWESFMPVLSTDECDVMAETGTKFLLVEGDGVGMNKLAIQTMVAHGMDVTIAHVQNYGHYSVIYDAMEQGIFSWAMGGSELPVNDNYTYYKLDRNSSYAN